MRCSLVSFAAATVSSTSNSILRSISVRARVYGLCIHIHTDCQIFVELSTAQMNEYGVGEWQQKAGKKYERIQMIHLILAQH
jgi:cytosine/adenosine deaminase-related metal-dependent hydrolase